MAKEIGKEAADEFKASNNKHIELEAIPIVIKRILYSIIESIITNLSKA